MTNNDFTASQIAGIKRAAKANVEALRTGVPYAHPANVQADLADLAADVARIQARGW